MRNLTNEQLKAEYQRMQIELDWAETIQDEEAYLVAEDRLAMVQRELVVRGISA